MVCLAVYYFNSLILSPVYVKADTRQEDFGRVKVVSWLTLAKTNPQKERRNRWDRRQVLRRAHGAVDPLIDLRVEMSSLTK